MALALPPRRPSPQLRARVLALPRRGRRALLWGLAASAAAAAVLLAVAFFAVPPPERTYAVVGTEAAPGASGEVAALGRRIRFEARDLPPLKPDRAWELWHLVPGRPPVPAGLYRPDAGGRVAGTAELAAAPAPDHGFALTMEPEGGSAVPTPPLYLIPAE